MNEMDFENRLRSIANGMEYPRTPDIAGSVTARLHTATRSRFNSKALAWSLTIILVLCSSLMLIPSARAAILEFIQIGVVRIFPQPVTPTIEPIRNATPVVQAPKTATSSSESLIPILNQMAGKTTLADVQKKVDFPILLPSYPSDLGEPDYVYIQNADGNMVILVWLDPQRPDKVFLSLHFIPSDSWVINKMGPKIIQETQVNGQRAIWAEGPYPLIMRDGNVDFTRLIEGHVLIWADNNITYRLETDLNMAAAVKIAESLKPIP
ncbi:MAG: hypothetical protein ABI904_20535 [Chloroflexota bacterium]